MAKRHCRPSAQFWYEHYDPLWSITGSRGTNDHAPCRN
jgi:hypothetical protein